MGKSVALPPQSIKTSILSFQSAIFLTLSTAAVLVKTLKPDGSRLVNTAESSISGFCLTAHSTPLPKFP